MTPERSHPVLHPERGIALVTALLVLLVVSVVAATFMATTSSERAISSNVHVARASLLAADAGVRTAQQTLANIGRAKLDSLIAIHSGGSTPIISNPGALFPVGLMPGMPSSTAPRFTTSATIAWSDSDLADSAQVWDFRYTITSTGQSGAQGGRQVQSTGVLRVSADRGTFAQFLLFTNAFTTSSGGSIWFTSDSRFDGRVHTNGEFRFAFKPYFSDKVSSVNSKAWYYNNGSPVERAANNNGTIDVPQFYGGFQRGAPNVTLPANSFNQQKAALGMAQDGNAPTTAQIRAALGITSGSGVPNDIYLVNSGGVVTGGLYVQGNLDQCTVVADTVNHLQKYIMRQGSTTRTITVNPNATPPTTSVTTGSTTVVYTGVPPKIIYTNGTMSSVGGPDRSGGVAPPALLDGQQLLINATGDIVLQKDLTVQHFDTGSAVLGLYSSGGDVRVGSSAPNDMYLDAFVMATGGGASGEGVFSVDNYNSGSPRGTFHLRGGAIQQYYGAFFTFNSSGQLQTGYARDFRYDRRGLVPPYFPTTPLFTQTDHPSARTLAWKEL